MTINCQVCGTANPDGTTYCEGCGVELATSAAANGSPSAESSSVAAPTPAASPTPAPSPAVEMPPLEETHAPATTSPTTLTPPADLTTSATIPNDALGGSVPASSAVATPAPEMPALETVVVAAAPAPAEASIPAEPVTPAEPVAAAVPAVPVTAPAQSTGEAKLGIKKFGAATGEFIPLQGERMVVGRFDASTGPVDIDLSGLTGQEHISRRHAELYREGGVWHVRDLGSTNGVYVKHKAESAFSPRLQEPAALTDGDEIAFGNLMMTFNQG